MNPVKNPKFIGTMALLATLAAATPAFAGNDGGGKEGGGGNAVVCFEDESILHSLKRVPGHPEYALLDGDQAEKASFVEILDLYEAERTGLGDIIPLPSGGASIPRYLERLEDRYEHSIPAVAQLLRESKAAFDLPNNLVADEEGFRESITDSAEIERMDKRCVLATMAMQYRRGGVDHMHVFRKLFQNPHHSRLSQAVTFVHELVYRKLRERGAKDSQSTRELVTAIISNHVTYAQVLRAMTAAGLMKLDRPLNPNRKLGPDDVVNPGFADLVVSQTCAFQEVVGPYQSVMDMAGGIVSADTRARGTPDVGEVNFTSDQIEALSRPLDELRVNGMEKCRISRSDWETYFSPSKFIRTLTFGAQNVMDMHGLNSMPNPLAKSRLSRIPRQTSIPDPILYMLDYRGYEKAAAASIIEFATNSYLPSYEEERGEPRW